jgi:Uncharacterized protein conserved in bacteria (DUF2330)
VASRTRFFFLPVVVGVVIAAGRGFEARACCPAPPPGKPVVNADQTVIIVWDPATQTEHFIRQASFKSAADDFGFLVPTPTQPQLEESGNEAFPLLENLTAPPVPWSPPQLPSLCCASAPCLAPDVRVVQEKRVAGFDAVVLEARSAESLVRWLKEHGYAFAPAIEAWAKPYIEAGWMITALKVVKEPADTDKAQVAASSLRISFKTDRPLFPYREPDSRDAAQALGAKQRLLRIYFVADGRYRGELTRDVAWTGRPVWSAKLKAADRKRILEALKLPLATGPAEWWLTEFEDNWPYAVAPADLYFSRDRNQQTLQRASNSQRGTPWPTDVWVYALAAALTLPTVARKLRQAR